MDYIESVKKLEHHLDNDEFKEANVLIEQMQDQVDWGNVSTGDYKYFLALEEEILGGLS